MMADMNVWKELTAGFNSGQLSQRRMKYFRWKHGLDTSNFTYSEMSEKDFLEWTGVTEIEYRNLQKWESTSHYKRLTFLLKEDEFASDLLGIYDSTKKLADDGDSAAIKNVLMLQKEIKKYRQDIDKYNSKVDESEEDDGLVV